MRHYFSSNLKQTRAIFVALLTGCVLSAFLVSCAHNVSKTHSLFITMKDGVKLAADVHLPEDLAADDIIITATRRSSGFWQPALGR